MPSEETRTPEEVLEDHLELRAEGRLADDLERNYSPDVIVFSCDGRFEGHDGVRKTASILEQYVPHDDYEYLNRHLEGDTAFLAWRARQEGREIHGGDSYVIRDGRIVVQTIHFVEIREPAA